MSARSVFLAPPFLSAEDNRMHWPRDADERSDLPDDRRSDDLRTQPHPQRAGATPDEPVSGLRILVVDDNLDSATTLTLLLQVEGHEVRTAYDGETALDLAWGWRPQIALLDIGLPGVDGYEVARRLRQEGNLHDVLLVAMTGYGQEEDRRRAWLAGFNAHLLKPVDLEQLRALLAHASSFLPFPGGRARR
jgi:CheY-like chemotaxis protein